MIVMRTSGAVVVTDSSSDAVMLVRMAEAANDRIQRLQGDGEESDE